MNKLLDKISVVILFAVILSFAVFGVLLPDNTYSEKENRELNQAPNLTPKKIFSGEYTSALGSYVADQFPLRDTFIGIKAYSEILQLKGENNEIIKTNHALIPRPKNDVSRLKDNLNCIEYFATENNLNVVVAPIPRVADVFSEYLPSSYPLEADREVWNGFKDETKNKSFNVADLYDLLCNSNEYYRTDHHYTSKGAYLVYKALGKELNYTPYSEDFFKVECVTKDFCGTSVRRSGFYLFGKDKIELYRYNDDDKYIINADGIDIALYDFSKLTTTDKYAVFLGGNHARVDITNGENRKRLLIIRDSYADSLVPFLALHFDITLIDLRYYTSSLSALAKEEGITNVLVLENIEELCTAKNISYLRMK
ncbi:MAG: hypothetical protein IIX54_02880 [Clostridia bacterium]|nr:hypothetical protein [Clostridia bacterium]